MSDESGAFVRRLAVANSLGGFDRFIMPPLLVTVAVDLDASLVEVSFAATIYYLVYGGAQPFWGLMSGRIGRLRTLRIGLVLGGLALILAGLAGGLALFVAARAVSAAAFAAIVPTSLIYLGDAIPEDRRQGAVADLLSGAAIGGATAALLGGLLADVGLWRGLLVAAGVLALFQASRLPAAVPATGAVATGRGRIDRRSLGWGVVVLSFSAVNASLVLAPLSFIPVAAESYGDPARLAGFAAAWYGVTYWAGARMVKSVARTTPLVMLLAGGATVMTAGLVVATVSRGWIGLSVATALVGSGFAFTNSSLQAWVIAVAPAARALVVSLFTTAGWVGGAIATAAVAPLADGGRFTTLFGACALTGAVLAVSAPLARSRWQLARAVPQAAT
jgi:MFS family permease